MSLVDIQLSVTGPLAGMKFTRQVGVCVCPKCHKKKLNYDLNKNIFQCFSSNCNWKGNGLEAYKFYSGIENNSDAYKDFKERIKHDSGLSMKAKEAAKEIKEVKETPLASIEDRDFCYKSLFKVLKLSQEHAQKLLKRGFTPEQLVWFRSLPKEKDTKIAVASKLISMGCKLDKIPGFFLLDGKWQLANSCSGILVPYFDLHGRIQGLQIRKDNDSEYKYSWLSSSYVPKWAKTCEYCTKAKTFVGWAGAWKDGKPLIPENGKVYLTEGWMKAKLAHYLSGNAFMAIPGVKCQENLKPFLKELKELGVKEIAIAYDMDRFMNLDVALSLTKISELIKNAGIHYSYVKWSAEYVTFNREHRKLRDGQFVYEYGKRDIPDTDTLLKNGYREVLFAFEKAADAESGLEDFTEYKEQNKDKIKITPVFYHLHLKGVDDYYAFYLKNIK